jgi:hypothetical protein
MILPGIISVSMSSTINMPLTNLFLDDVIFSMTSLTSVQYGGWFTPCPWTLSSLRVFVFRDKKRKYSWQKEGENTTHKICRILYPSVVFLVFRVQNTNMRQHTFALLHFRNKNQENLQIYMNLLWTLTILDFLLYITVRIWYICHLICPEFPTCIKTSFM